jgi:hypothetical protein
MSEIKGIDIEEVITIVKKAINLAQQRQKGSELGINIKEVVLTLKGVSQKSVGGGFKIKIPFLDLEAGISGEYKKLGTQIIELTLVPAKEVGAKGLPEDIDRNLVDAINVIRRGVRKALEGEPRFEFVRASIELDFVFDLSGDIALVGKSGVQSEVTNTIKLIFSPMKI